MKKATKLHGVNLALSLSAKPLTVPAEMADVLDIGIVRDGQNYRNAFWQTKLLIDVQIAWWKQPADVRHELLKDPWQFKNFVIGVPAFNNWAMQQLLLHYVHPDTFEPIMTRSDKAAIASTLAEGDEQKIDDVDRKLLAIRTRLTATHGEGFSFYEQTLNERWKPAAAAADTSDGGDDEESDDDSVVQASADGEFRCWKVAPGDLRRIEVLRCGSGHLDPCYRPAAGPAAVQPVT